jgi:hypothetical protein
MLFWDGERFFPAGFFQTGVRRAYAVKVALYPPGQALSSEALSKAVTIIDDLRNCITPPPCVLMTRPCRLHASDHRQLVFPLLHGLGILRQL